MQRWYLHLHLGLLEDQRLEQILTIVDALADRVSDTGASVQVPRVVSGWQWERKSSTIQTSSEAV